MLLFVNNLFVFVNKDMELVMICLVLKSGEDRQNLPGWVRCFYADMRYFMSMAKHIRATK